MGGPLARVVSKCPGASLHILGEGLALLIGVWYRPQLGEITPRGWGGGPGSRVGQHLGGQVHRGPGTYIWGLAGLGRLGSKSGGAAGEDITRAPLGGACMGEGKWRGSRFGGRLWGRHSPP